MAQIQGHDGEFARLGDCCDSDISEAGMPTLGLSRVA